ncbi:MAG: stage V sporulation protein S [Caldilineaceae bacterium]|nr:stage V sporulation protein S [Caldilineaceae bacterium]
MEEESAITFLTALRRFGLSARQLGLHRRPTRGRYGTLLTPDLSLDEALPLVHLVDCLIIPGSLEHLQCHHDPRLQQFLRAVCLSARSLVLQMDDLESNLLCDRSRTATLYGYLPGPDLPHLAHHLAESLLTHQEFRHPHIHLEVLQGQDQPIRVAADAQPPSIAGAIAHSLRARSSVQVRAIGMMAVYKSIKAIIMARRYLITDNLDLQISPSFIKVIEQGGEERSVICLDIATISSFASPPC